MPKEDVAEFFIRPSFRTSAVPVDLVAVDDFSAWLEKQDAPLRRWITESGFDPAPGCAALIPNSDGGLLRVVTVMAAEEWLWSCAGLAGDLPAGSYRIATPLSSSAADQACLGWALGRYRFDRYHREEKGKKGEKKNLSGKGAPPRLLWPEKADPAHVLRIARGVFLVRDLINTPAQDMGPDDLAGHARRLARAYKARCTVIAGPALVEKNYPAIFAVGKGSERRPCLIDLRWGAARHPKVTVVGKGVCFDTGGLNLKPDRAMKLMKKDMGGAAHALALGQMVMDAALPVRLRVLVPAVENTVSGDAMRPLDVIETRKGSTVEIGHTDAEGRLILADALFEGDKESPDLLIDFATLTGAARVALGTDMPAVFSNDQDLAATLVKTGVAEDDPLWQLPLWRPYARQLKSDIADLNNVSSSPYGGAITAALFLEHFVGKKTPWVHLDLMGWNESRRPGRPVGGEAMGLRALFALLRDRYGKPPRRRRT